jgi:anthranilate/para-aminobenzoate synthase component II
METLILQQWPAHFSETMRLGVALIVAGLTGEGLARFIHLPRVSGYALAGLHAEGQVTQRLFVFTALNVLYSVVLSKLIVGGMHGVIQHKPVLGICRGLQLINVACGGTLYQDIVEQYPNAAMHRDDALYDGFHHLISMVEGSRLASLFPHQSSYAVNSIHHQAIKTLGNDLLVEANAADDGLIEAIRWTGNGYMFGCQWHPELQADIPGLLDSSPIMAEFLEAARLTKPATV